MSIIESQLRSFYTKILLRVKRKIINYLGLVSDQYFYLDSYMEQRREKGIERIALYSPSCEVEFITPSNGKLIKSFFLDRYLYKLDEASIDPISGFIYDQEGIFIAESSAWNLLRGFYSWPKPFIKIPKKILNGDYIFLNDIGYGHWLLEDLPAFLAAYKEYPKATILCPENPSSFLKYFLNLLDAKILYLNAPACVENLIMAGKSSGYGHPAHGLSYNPIDIENVREFFKDSISKDEKNKFLFVSRSGESRCPSNIHEVEEYVTSRGYSVVNTDLKLNLMEQVQLFSSAKKVVGIHGAALMNIVWCDEGTEIIEIFTNDYMPTAFSSISSVRMLNYSWFSYGDSCEDSIDISMLESFL